MDIVVHEMGTYAHAQQLAKTLAARGHEVTYLYCPSVQSPSRSSMCFVPGDKVTVRIVELSSDFAKWRLVKRFVQERAYGAKIAAIVARLRPDVIISGNTPIEIQAAIQKMCRRSGTPFLFWLQDIYSIGVRSVVSKIPIVGHLIAARYAFLERRVARDSDGIIAISDDFRDLLLDWAVEPHRIAVIGNWGALPPGPLPAKDNDWAARHGLLDKRVILYSGALGFKHNPQLFLDLASEFCNDPDVRVVVISEGYGAEWLARRQQEFPGLLLLGFQPEADFHKALAAADVLVAILEPDAAKYSVPSKVLTYMTAGRAILAAIPSANLASRTILAASAGMIADPADQAGLCRLARSMIDDPERRARFGAAALAYARANFEIDGIARQFEEIFYRFASHRMGASARRGRPGEIVAPLG